MMRTVLHRFSALAAPCVALLATAPGCSLENKPHGLTVQLMDQASRIATASQFELLAVPSTKLQSGGEVNCYGVNVTSSLIPASSPCGFAAGTTTSMSPGIASTFSLLVPISTDLRFEAYASASSGCPGSLVGAGATTLYRVGAIQAPSPMTDTVTVPVSFDRNAGFTCDGSLPTAYFDTLFYSGVNSGLSSMTNAVWTTAGGLTDIQMSGGNAVGGTNANEGDFPNGVALNGARASYRISVNINVATTPTQAAQVRVGLSDSSTSGTTGDVVGCEIDYTNSLSTIGGFSVGTGNSGFGLPGSCGGGCASSSGLLNLSVGNDTLICDIARSGTSWNVTASLVDASGNVLGSFSKTGATNQCTGNGCIFPFLQINNAFGLGILPATLTNYLVQESLN